MTASRHVSGRLVAGLFEKGLAGAVTPELEAHLAAVGIELGALRQTYPHATWVRGLEVTAGELYAGEELSEGLRKLGVRVIKTLHQSGIVKGPILTMGRLMGPRRVLKQLHAQPVRGAEFLHVQVREKSGQHLEVEFNDGAVGDFVSGALEEVLHVLGATRPKVHPKITTPQQCVLDVTWS